MARPITSTYSSPGARFSASARPIPRDLTFGDTLAAGRHTGVPAASTRLTRITLAALPLLAAASIAAGGPLWVAVPLAVLLLIGRGEIAAPAWAARRVP